MNSNLRYRLIRGEFHIFYPDQPRNGPQPDGDTIKFKPDRRELIQSVKRFSRNAAEFNQRGMVSVRSEGIDTLETHFITSGGQTRQNEHFAYKARDMVIERLGFEEVRYHPHNRNLVASVANNPRPGYLITGGVDSHGRVIGFIYSEKNQRLDQIPDGEAIFVGEAELMESINYHLVEQGLAYAEFYTTLPIELAECFKKTVKKGRKTSRGLWSAEALNTQKTAEITPKNLRDLVIWPKLFRRLAAFFAEGWTELAQFDNWLRNAPDTRDDRLILPDREFGNMHDLFILDGEKMRLRYEPEEIIILPDP